MSTDLTRTNIMNLALRELGNYRIADWEEDSTAAEAGRDVWDQVLRRALAAHNWRFATRQVQLQRASSAPNARYAYAYTLPEDMMKMGPVADNDELDPMLTQYEVIELGEKLVLCTSYESVYLEYVYEHTTVGRWPAHFIDVMAAMLALALVPSLKTNRGDFDKLVERRLASARSIDSQQRPPRRPPLGSWARSMRGNIR